MSDDGLVALGLVGVSEGMLTAARARTSHYRRRGHAIHQPTST
ncbi:DNA polymerase III subunit chi [Dactylosporangium siamense]|nr:DNA polymerase III subunit chi [Dactylosporangium siamense]